MATTRRRVSRGRDGGLTAQIRALFGVGCGWEAYGDDEVQRLWNEHGRDYRRHDPDSFAERILGPPVDPDRSSPFHGVYCDRPATSA